MEDLSRRHFAFDLEIPDRCHSDIVSAQDERASTKVVFDEDVKPLPGMTRLSCSAR